MHITNAKTVLMFILCIGSCQAWSQASSVAPGDDLFAGTERFAKNADTVTQVDMDRQSLDLVEGVSAQKAHRLVLSVVHQYSYANAGLYSPAEVDFYLKKLVTPEWQCSVFLHDPKAGTANEVCTRPRKDGLIETAIIEVESRQLTFIHTIKKAH